MVVAGDVVQTSGSNTVTHLEVNSIANFRIGDLVTFPAYQDFNGWVKAITASGIDLAYPLPSVPVGGSQININRKHYLRTDTDGKLQIGGAVSVSGGVSLLGGSVVGLDNNRVSITSGQLSFDYSGTTYDFSDIDKFSELQITFDDQS